MRLFSTAYDKWSSTLRTRKQCLFYVNFLQACIDGNLDVVQFLVEHQAEIDQEDNEGWTPLHAAASCGFMDIAK